MKSSLLASAEKGPKVPDLGAENGRTPNRICHDCVSSVCSPCECPVSCFERRSKSPRLISAAPPEITIHVHSKNGKGFPTTKNIVASNNSSSNNNNNNNVSYLYHLVAKSNNSNEGSPRTDSRFEGLEFPLTAGRPPGELLDPGFQPLVLYKLL